jgi:hypothetical protein
MRKPRIPARRSSLFFVIVMALIGTVFSPAALAAPTQRPASFCGTARKLAPELQAAISGDPTKEKFVKAQLKAYQRLAQDAPDKLARPFKVVVRYWKNVDAASSPQAISLVLSEELPRTTPANEKIFNYLQKNCGNLGG